MESLWLTHQPAVVQRRMVSSAARQCNRMASSCHGVLTILRSRAGRKGNYAHYYVQIAPGNSFVGESDRIVNCGICKYAHCAAWRIEFAPACHWSPKCSGVLYTVYRTMDSGLRTTAQSPLLGHSETGAVIYAHDWKSRSRRETAVEACAVALFRGH